MEDWIQTTKLFQQWRQVRKAVDDHKWYESEKAGHDIGWDRAYTDWLIHHSSEAERLNDR